MSDLSALAEGKKERIRTLTNFPPRGRFSRILSSIRCGSRALEQAPCEFGHGQKLNGTTPNPATGYDPKKLLDSVKKHYGNSEDCFWAWLNADDGLLSAFIESHPS